jgi:Uri superfamily endonuclease
VVQRLIFLKGHIYILGVEINQDIQISVGKLGKIGFYKGFYLYVGSAKDRLSTRLARHLSRDKRLFWHIDYLLASPAVCIKKIWINGNKSECSVVRLINRNVKSQIIRGFGSSDCCCPGHLVFVEKVVTLERFFKNQRFRKIKLNYAG